MKRAFCRFLLPAQRARGLIFTARRRARKRVDDARAPGAS
jgi:hypothetical protein